MREASRFKKRALIQMLEQFEQSMVRVETKRLSAEGVNSATISAVISATNSAQPGGHNSR